MNLLLAAVFAAQIVAAAYAAGLGLSRVGVSALAERTMRSDRLVHTVPVVAGAVGAAFARGTPAGLHAADVTYRMALAVLCTLACAKASDFVVCVATVAGIAAMLARSGQVGAASMGVAAAALGLALLRAHRYRGSRLLGAASGALAANTFLHLPTALPSRAPSIVASLAIAALVLSALGRSNRRARRFAAAGIAGASLVALAGAATAFAAARSARHNAEAGIAEARRALDATSRGEADNARDGFRRASGRLRAAHDVLTTPTAQLGRVLPVVGPNLAAARVLTARGADVAARASSAVGAVDLPAMRTPDGRIDVSRIAALQGPLANARDAVADALDALRTTHGPWIAPALRDQADGLRDELRRASRSSADAAAMVHVLPDILGRHGPRRYLIVILTPSEARGSGGLIGNYGEITAVDGKVQLSRFGRTEELQENGVPVSQRTLDAPPDYLRRYMPFEVNQLWQNLTLSPDFPSTAQAIASLYPQSGGAPIDGVIAADPFALAGILRLTGPITVDGWPDAFGPDNTPKVLLYDLYAALSITKEANEQRAGIQQRLAQQAFARLLTGPLPTPSALGAALGGPVHGRHLQMWMTRGEERSFITRIGADGAVPSVAGDSFAVVTNNAGANKIDWYLRRQITYDATVDARAASVSATATVELENAAPSSGVAPYLIGNKLVPPAPLGTSIQYVSFYSPLALVGATIDGNPLSLAQDTELGRNVYSGWLRIPPGGRVRVMLRLRGAPQDRPRDQLYALRPGCQAMVNDDRLHVIVRVQHPSTGPAGGTFDVTGLSPVADRYEAVTSQPCTAAYALTARR